MQPLRLVWSTTGARDDSDDVVGTDIMHCRALKTLVILMSKTFIPDPRYVPQWPRSPFATTLGFSGFRIAMSSQEGEAAAFRLEKLWSCPTLSSGERALLLRQVECLEAADANIGIPGSHTQAVKKIQIVNRLLAQLESEHGTVAPRGQR